MSSKIGHLPLISAVYYALLQSGYEFYSLGRDEDFSGTVRSFAGEETVPDFFRLAKKDDGRVYPYWPGAFILEAASLNLNDDLTGFRDILHLKERINGAGNIDPADKDDKLWNWLDGFPDALKKVTDTPGFKRYLSWEDQWIGEQSVICMEDLELIDGLAEECRQRYGAEYSDISIVLCPVKCVYASDYHLQGDRFIFTSGELRTDSVIHEYLHTVIHPLIGKDLTIIEGKRWKDIDESYYLGGTPEGHLNAFEEYAVREITRKFMDRERIPDLKEMIIELSLS